MSLGQSSGLDKTVDLGAHHFDIIGHPDSALMTPPRFSLEVFGQCDQTAIVPEAFEFSGVAGAVNVCLTASGKPSPGAPFYSELNISNKFRVDAAVVVGTQRETESHEIGALANARFILVFTGQTAAEHKGERKQSEPSDSLNTALPLSVRAHDHSPKFRRNNLPAVRLLRH